MRDANEGDKKESLTIEMTPPFAVRQGLSNLANQPIQNVLLLSLTAFVMGAFGYYVSWIEPANKAETQKHITELVKGFTESTERQQDIHAKNIEKIQVEHTSQVKAIVDHESEIHKSNLEHAEKAADRRQKDEMHREQLLKEIMGKGAPEAKNQVEDNKGANLNKPNPFGG